MIAGQIALWHGHMSHEIGMGGLVAWTTKYSIYIYIDPSACFPDRIRFQTATELDPQLVGGARWAVPSQATMCWPSFWKHSWERERLWCPRGPCGSWRSEQLGPHLRCDLTGTFKQGSNDATIRHLKVIPSGTWTTACRRPCLFVHFSLFRGVGQ